MSRCFPFPPPWCRDIWIDSIKLLQKEKEKKLRSERRRSSKQSSHDHGSAYKVRGHPLKKHRKHKTLKSKSELLVAFSDIVDSLGNLTLCKDSTPQPESSYEAESPLKIPSRPRKHRKRGEFKLKYKLQYQVASSGISHSLANLNLRK